MQSDKEHTIEVLLFFTDMNRMQRHVKAKNDARLTRQAVSMQ